MLSQVLPKEFRYFFKRYNALLVIQVSVARVRYDQQLLVVTLQSLESVSAEVTGMRLFAVNHKHRAADFVAVTQKRHVDERQGRSDVPTIG